jgi:hypothetical protein
MEGWLLKGRVEEKQGQLGDAALHYEQVAKYGDAEQASAGLFKLSKMRMRQKDFYEAFFDIRRAFQYSCCTEPMKSYRTLIEGVSLLSTLGR